MQDPKVFAPQYDFTVADAARRKEERLAVAEHLLAVQEREVKRLKDEQSHAEDLNSERWKEICSLRCKLQTAERKLEKMRKGATNGNV